MAGRFFTAVSGAVSVASTATATLLTITASGPVRIHRISVTADDTAADSPRAVMSAGRLSTAGSGTTVTPGKLDANSDAAQSSAAHTVTGDTFETPNLYDDFFDPTTGLGVGPAVQLNDAETFGIEVTNNHASAAKNFRARIVFEE